MPHSFSYNDPDPIRWMALYGAASATSALAAARRPLPTAAMLLLAAAAVAWSTAIMAGGLGAADLRRMFDAWEIEIRTY